MVLTSRCSTDRQNRSNRREEISEEKSQLGMCIRPNEGIPKILLLAPPPLGKLTDFADMFAGGTEKSRQLSQHIQRGADLWGCAFMDTAQVIVSSDVDGVHFDPGEHRKLGVAVAEIERKMNL